MNTRSLPMLVAMLVLGIASFGFAGCGGDDDEDGEAEKPAATAPAEEEPAEEPAGGAELKLAADPGGAFKFDKAKLTAQAGKVTIVMDNPSSLPHDVNIEQDGKDLADGDVVQKGEKSTASADLEAGEYEFYCSVPGHRDGGMEGTLTVE